MFFRNSVELRFVLKAHWNITQNVYQEPKGLIYLLYYTLGIEETSAPSESSKVNVYSGQVYLFWTCRWKFACS